MSKYIHLSNDICNVIRNYLMINRNTIKKLHNSLLYNQLINRQYEYFQIRKNNDILEIQYYDKNFVMVLYKHGNIYVPWYRDMISIPLRDIIKYENEYLIKLWKENYKKIIN